MPRKFIDVYDLQDHTNEMVNDVVPKIIGNAGGTGGSGTATNIADWAEKDNKDVIPVEKTNIADWALKGGTAPLPVGQAVEIPPKAQEMFGDNTVSTFGTLYDALFDGFITIAQNSVSSTGLETALKNYATIGVVTELSNILTIAKDKVSGVKEGVVLTATANLDLDDLNQKVVDLASSSFAANTEVEIEDEGTLFYYNFSQAGGYSSYCMAPTFYYLAAYGRNSSSNVVKWLDEVELSSAGCHISNFKLSMQRVAECIAVLSYNMPPQKIQVGMNTDLNGSSAYLPAEYLYYSSLNSVNGYDGTPNKNNCICLDTILRGGVPSISSALTIPTSGEQDAAGTLVELETYYVFKTKVLSFDSSTKLYTIQVWYLDVGTENTLTVKTTTVTSSTRFSPLSGKVASN